MAMSDFLGLKPKSFLAFEISKSCCKPENIAISFTLNKGALPDSLLPNSINQAIKKSKGLGTAIGNFIFNSGNNF